MMRILSLMIVLFWPHHAWAQSTQEEILIVSERVGDTIDSQERVQFKLFSSIAGFQSAQFIRQPGGAIIARIQTLDKENQTQVRELNLTEKLFYRIREVIDHFEAIQADTYTSVPPAEPLPEETIARPALKKPRKSSHGTKWVIPSVIGYMGSGLIVAAGLLVATNPSLDDPSLLVLPLGGMIGGGFIGGKIGVRADTQLSRGQSLSGAHRNAIRVGTVLAGTTMGVLASVLAINPKGNNGEGSDENIQKFRHWRHTGGWAGTMGHGFQIVSFNI